METITKDLADYVEQRVKEALISKEEKLKKLEQDKAKLVRMTSELKHEMKNMKVIVSMYEKRMSNPTRNNVIVEHKCVGCDFRMNLPQPSNNLGSIPSFLNLAPSSEFNDSVRGTPKSVEKLTLAGLLKQEDIKPFQRKNTNSYGSEFKVNGNLDNWVKRSEKPTVSSTVEVSEKLVLSTPAPGVIESKPLNAPELQSLLTAPLPSIDLQPKLSSSTVKRQKSEESKTETFNDNTKLSNNGNNHNENKVETDVELIDLSDEEDKL